MVFRKATKDDIPEIMKIINDAKNYFKENKINQWQNGYPNEISLENDIKNNFSYIYCNKNKPIATCALCFENDSNYNKIFEGTWCSSLPYAAIHRIAVSKNYKGQGIAGKFISELIEICKKNGFASVRVDTHEDNHSMQNLILKCGFVYCGIIYLASNGDSRLAYELLLDS